MTASLSLSSKSEMIPWELSACRYHGRSRVEAISV